MNDDPGSKGPKAAKAGARRFQLLGGEALGGHRARKGFRFQDLWLSFQLLDWIAQEDFRGAINEGADDVDASWFQSDKRGRKPRDSNFDWEIYQLKDTSVTPKMLAEIFDAFLRKEADFPTTWSRYHLIATRCAEKLHSLTEVLRHTRDRRSAYGTESDFAKAAVDDFGKTLTRLGIDVDPTFVVERVELDFDAGWVVQRMSFLKQFHIRLAGHGIPLDQVGKAGQALVALVSGEGLGSLISREAVLALLGQFKPMVGVAIPAPAVVPVTTPAAVLQTFTQSGAEDSILISILAGGGALLRLSDGKYGLVDCNRTAATQVAAYIEALSIEALEFVAISHWDLDRFSGLLSVMSAVKGTQSVFLPPFPAVKGHSVTRFLSAIESDAARRCGIGKVVQTGARSTIWSSPNGRDYPRVETFASDTAAEMIDRQLKAGGLTKNDLCSVFRVSVAADRHFLITGDASVRCWGYLFRLLLGPEQSLRADGFTLPHHGSRHAINKDILGRIADPAGFYAVVDPAPFYGLPRSDVLSLVREANGEILVADTTPIHLLLTAGGLFERRFGLGRAGDLRVMPATLRRPF